MEPTLFGIGKADWELYNSFSNWLSAVGTLAAVIVSLYLARRSGRPRAKVSVGHRIVITPGDKREPPEVIVFRIVNTGDRTIRITNIGWRIGLRNKRYAIQMYDPTQSSPLPVELAHGQEASWTVPLDAREDPWLESFSNKMLKPNLWLSCATIKAQFHTSIGEVFMVKPERDLIQMLRQAGRAGKQQ
ncbi:MAG: hypothetical protein IPO57_14290 [Rhodocyclales bacterium]|nr:hypothetical protein [Rhodocyclales bacterium]